MSVEHSTIGSNGIKFSSEAPPAQKLSKEQEELNFAKKLAVLLIGAPPALAMAASITLLAKEINLTTLRPEISQNLIGFKFDKYTEQDCHIGVHPNSSNKDLHIVCYKGNGPYLVIIPNIMP